MPGFDRTGPQGAGSRTGRSRGYCGGYANPTFMGRGGFGFGRMGAGRGWRHRFYATGVPGWTAVTPEQETDDLKAQAEFLKTQLDAIQKRIDELIEK